MDGHGLSGRLEAVAGVDENTAALYAQEEVCASMILFGIGSVLEPDVEDERTDVSRAIHIASDLFAFEPCTRTTSRTY